MSLDEPSISDPPKEVVATVPITPVDDKVTKADFDETEKSLGISVYMSQSQPFSAVVKARYSDFVVHEVGLDGTIARLTSRKIPEEMKDPKPEEDEEAKVDVPAPSTDWSVLQSQLEGMIKEAAVAEKTMSMLKAHNDSGEESSGEEKFVVLPALEKPERKAIHGWIRESLPCARADTVDGRIRIWHIRFEKEMPNYKTFGNSHKKKKAKQGWPHDRPDYLQFVMYKENLDTTTATKELSRKGSKARIGYAGMKDKRGITAQYCTLYRTEPQQIISQRHAGGGNTKQNGYSVVQVGNFQYVSKEIRLGSLKGNRFDMILRNVQGDAGAVVDKQVLEDAAQAMKVKGFINYFGTQRFGKYKDTHLTGIAVLQGNFRKAIEIIMEPKQDDRPDADKARKDWRDRFQNGETADNEVASAKRVIKSLNRFMTAENSIMQCLSRKPMQYQTAFSHIPKTLRMMFLHAVQSLIWNQASSYRIESMNSESVLVGDLVQTGEDSSMVKLVTEDDIANKRYTLQDVVIPLVGTKSQLPANELGDLMKKLFKDVGVELDMFKKVQDKDLAIYGDYRKLLVRPSDCDYEIKEYYDPLQPLMQNDLMKLNGEEIEIAPMKDGEDLKLAMIVGFTLPSSSYATIALRELMKRPTSTDYQKVLKL
jgi:tRNA pseudouridine13 synthase